MRAAVRKRGTRLLRRNEEGATIVEFALIAPTLMLFVMGIIEVAMVLFVSMLLEGSVREAGRYGITGYVYQGFDRIAIIRKIVEQNTIGLVDMEKVKIETLTYQSFSAVGQPEPFSDTNGNGQRDAGEAFNDVNGNGTWDDDMGVNGAGGPGDIVVYTITYDWPLLTTFLGDLMGRAGIMQLSASYAVRNEPWDIGIVGEE
jgi:Flp pilus assembly protein TadG